MVFYFTPNMYTSSLAELPQDYYQCYCDVKSVRLDFLTVITQSAADWAV